MESGSGTGIGLFGTLIYLAFVVLLIVSVWKVFVKAGRPGWAALIPIYNTYVQLQISGKPWWWLLLMLVPLLNIVIMIMATAALAKVFDKGSGFAIGLIFLPFIFYPILAFGNAEYRAPLDPSGAALQAV